MIAVRLLKYVCGGSFYSVMAVEVEMEHNTHMEVTVKLEKCMYLFIRFSISGTYSSHIFRPIECSDEFKDHPRQFLKKMVYHRRVKRS